MNLLKLTFNLYEEKEQQCIVKKSSFMEINIGYYFYS